MCGNCMETRKRLLGSVFAIAFFVGFSPQPSFAALHGHCPGPGYILTTPHDYPVLPHPVKTGSSENVLDMFWYGR
jgi:hypothetical protein